MAKFPTYVMFCACFLNVVIAVIQSRGQLNDKIRAAFVKSISNHAVKPSNVQFFSSSVEANEVFNFTARVAFRCNDTTNFTAMEEDIRREITSFGVKSVAPIGKADQHIVFRFRRYGWGDFGCDAGTVGCGVAAVGKLGLNPIVDGGCLIFGYGCLVNGYGAIPSIPIPGYPG